MTDAMGRKIALIRNTENRTVRRKKCRTSLSERNPQAFATVSYTHLTLPTIYSV